MAQHIGAGSYAEDVVQEMYIKMYNCSTPIDKIAPNGIVNPWYVYRTIYSINIDLHRVKAKVTKVSLQDAWPELQSIDIDAYNHDIDTLIDIIESELKSWPFYERTLIDIHCKQGDSLGKISRKTGISKRSIHYTIQHAKEKLKVAVTEAASAEAITRTR